MTTYAVEITAMSETNTAGWLKFNLGHLLTICAMVIGFVLSNQQTTDKVDSLQSGLTDLKSSFKAMELNENASTLTMKDLQAKELEHDKSFDYINKRFDGHDSRISNVESQISTLNTNLQLVNQQLQYIGTSHIVPSSKK